MKISESNSRVVSTVEKEIWKPIPGYTKKLYEASNLGRIRKCTGYKEYRILHQSENKTTKGTYFNSYVVHDLGKGNGTPVHQLVCLAFHGEPPDDGQNWEPNHIDGNKHNNRENNLEWMTHQDNMFHALKTGLRSDNLILEVHDNTTNLWTTYYSINEASRQLSLPRDTIRKAIGRYKSKLFMDRWTFKLDIDRLGKINRPHHNSIIAKDYVNDTVIITNDAAEMYYQTGIQSTTIGLRTGNGLNKVKNPDLMVGGYVFKELVNATDIKWPEYTKDMAITSRGIYFSKNPIQRNVPYLLKDYLTNEVIEYATLKQLCHFKNIKYNLLLDRLNNKELTLYKGCVIKRKSCLINWPEYSRLYIENSLTDNWDPRSIPLNVTDVLFNTTKLYRSMAEFARELGKDPDKFGVIVKSHVDKLYLDRYKMELIKF